MKPCSHCHLRPQATPKHPWCNECKKEGLRAWRSRPENRERERARARERYALDPALKAKQRERYAANPQPQRERNRARYSANPERKRRQNAAWRQANLDWEREYQKAWRDANPDRVREFANRATRRRAERMASVLVIPFTLDELAARLSMFAGCWMCGGPKEQVDHVKPLAKGGAHVLANLRPACKSCNSRKRDRWPLADPQ